jgi:hypothetical protein
MRAYPATSCTSSWLSLRLIGYAHTRNIRRVKAEENRLESCLLQHRRECLESPLHPFPKGESCHGVRFLAPYCAAYCAAYCALKSEEVIRVVFFSLRRDRGYRAKRTKGAFVLLRVSSAWLIRGSPSLTAERRRVSQAVLFG